MTSPSWSTYATTVAEPTSPDSQGDVPLGINGELRAMSRTLVAIHEEIRSLKDDFASVMGTSPLAAVQVRSRTPRQSRGSVCPPSGGTSLEDAPRDISSPLHHYKVVTPTATYAQGEDIGRMPSQLSSSMLPTIFGESISHKISSTTAGGGASRGLIPVSPCISRPRSAMSATSLTIPALAKASVAGEACPMLVRMRPGLVTHMQEIDVICDDAGSINVKVEDLHINNEPEETMPPTRWVLEPASRLRLTVDVASLVVLSYDLCVTPFLMAWDMSLTTFWMVGIYITVCYWIIDMLFSFRTGYYKDGRLEMRGSMIALHYLKTNFIVDFCVIATDLLALGMSSQDDHAGVAGDVIRFTKAGRLLRLVGVLRVSHVAEIFSRLTVRYAGFSVAFNIFWIMLIMLYINHVIACFWFFVGKNGGSDTGSRWLECPGTKFGETFHDLPTAYQYTTAFHYSLTQMTPGSMAVGAENSLERIATCSLLLFGVLTFGTLVSSLSGMMMDIRKRAKKQEHALTALRRYLRNIHASSSLAFNIEHHVHQRLLYERPLTHHDVEALDLLSAKLRCDLDVEVYEPHIKSFPILRICCQVDKGLIRKLALDAVDIDYVDESTFLFDSGKEAVATYVLTKGKATYMLEASESQRGDVIAEVEVGTWLAEAALWCYWTHGGTLSPGLGGCTVVKIGCEGFASVMQYRKLTRDIVSVYAATFCCRLQESVNAGEGYLDDLETSAASFDEIILSLTDSLRVFMGLVAISILREKHSRAWADGVELLTVGLGKTSRSELLEDEVRDKKSTLIVTPSGEVERVVAVACIKITRRDDQRFFAHLGKVVSGDKVIPYCALPGTKMKEGTTVTDALSPLLHGGELQMFNDMLVNERRAREVEWLWSQRYGMNTKYIRHIQEAWVDGNQIDELTTVKLVAMCDTSSGVISPQPGRVGRSSSLLLVDDPIITFGHKDGIYVSGWLTLAEFAALKKPTAEASLAKWLEKLPIAEAVQREAHKPMAPMGSQVSYL